MTPAEMKDIVSELKKNEIKPEYKTGHATCCRGHRLGQDHSTYCFTLKGFYTMMAHPSLRLPFNRRMRRLEAIK